MTLWTEHVKRWANCQRCSLKHGRKQVVFAKGQLPCDALIVGEAPGASENLIGTPFEGPAGHLLDEIIAEAMPTPPLRLCYTNVVGCFPAEAKQTKDHRPPPEAIKACAPRVKEIYEMARPRLVVCVGETARDNIHLGVDTANPMVKVVHILHPAAIMRLPYSAQGRAKDSCITTLITAFDELIKGGIICQG
jgi:uracil-DNA glycosylase family 4